MFLKHSFHSLTCQVADLEMSALHHHGLYIDIDIDIDIDI